MSSAGETMGGYGADGNGSNDNDDQYEEEEEDGDEEDDRKPAASGAADVTTAPPKKKRRRRRVVSTLQESKWQAMYGRLLNYKGRFGNVLVPNRYSEDPSLGAWVATQRRNYRLFMSGSDQPSGMTAERVQSLEAIGFQWTTTDPRHEPWEVRYEELKAFVKNYGHAEIPMRWEENVQLSNWVSKQRQDYKLRMQGKSTRLTDGRMKLLNDLGFRWHIPRKGRKIKKGIPVIKSPGEQEAMSSGTEDTVAAEGNAHSGTAARVAGNNNELPFNSAASASSSTGMEYLSFGDTNPMAAFGSQGISNLGTSELNTVPGVQNAFSVFASRGTSTAASSNNSGGMQPSAPQPSLFDYMSVGQMPNTVSEQLSAQSPTVLLMIQLGNAVLNANANNQAQVMPVTLPVSFHNPPTNNGPQAGGAPQSNQTQLQGLILGLANQNNYVAPPQVPPPAPNNPATNPTAAQAAQFLAQMMSILTRQPAQQPQPPQPQQAQPSQPEQGLQQLLANATANNQMALQQPLSQLQHFPQPTQQPSPQQQQAPPHLQLDAGSINAGTNSLLAQLAPFLAGQILSQFGQQPSRNNGQPQDPSPQQQPPPS